MINFRRSHDEPIPRQSLTSAHHRAGQLKNIRVEKNAWHSGTCLRRTNQHPHRAAINFHINIFGGNDHQITTFSEDYYLLLRKLLAMALNNTSSGSWLCSQYIMPPS